MKEQPAATSTAREPINLTDAIPAAIFFVDYFRGAFSMRCNRQAWSAIFEFGPKILHVLAPSRKGFSFDSACQLEKQSAEMGDANAPTDWPISRKNQISQNARKVRF